MVDLKARLAALKEKNSTQGNNNENNSVPSNISSQSSIQTGSTGSIPTSNGNISSINQSTGASIGTSIQTLGQNNNLTSSSTSTSVSPIVEPQSKVEVSFKDLEFLTKLDELQSALLTSHPRMPALLRELHTHLRGDPELVTTLTEEQIGIIVNGLKKQTATELTATASAKQGKAAGKKMAISVDML